MLTIPVVANGDIWNLSDFRRCREETSCHHFMIGRGALANPNLSGQIAVELGLVTTPPPEQDWYTVFSGLIAYSSYFPEDDKVVNLMRLKQWSKLAWKYGDFPEFDFVKTATSLPEFFDRLSPSSRLGTDAILTKCENLIRV